MQATEANIPAFAQIILWNPSRLSRKAVLRKIEKLHGAEYAEKVKELVIEKYNGGKANDNNPGK